MRNLKLIFYLLECEKFTALDQVSDDLNTPVIPIWKPSPKPWWKVRIFMKRGVQKEIITVSSNFLIRRHKSKIFFNIKLSFVNNEALPGEMYNKCRKEIIPKEAETQLSQVEL